MSNISPFSEKINPLVLASVGDSVYDLLVREKLACDAKNIGELHKRRVEFVNAKAQANATKVLQEHLTATEAEIFRRGRNAKTNSTPQGATTGEYHAATAIEAVFGFLWLSGNIERLRELFEIIWGI